MSNNTKILPVFLNNTQIEPQSENSNTISPTSLRNLKSARPSDFFRAASRNKPKDNRPPTIKEVPFPVKKEEALPDNSVYFGGTIDNLKWLIGMTKVPGKWKSEGHKHYFYPKKGGWLIWNSRSKDIGMPGQWDEREWHLIHSNLTFTTNDF